MERLNRSMQGRRICLGFLLGTLKENIGKLIKPLNLLEVGVLYIPSLTSPNLRI